MVSCLPIKSAEEIADSIALLIGHIYFRPLMYGGTPEGVELILWCYHDLWSDIFGLREQFDTVRRTISEEEDCGNLGFAHRYKRRYPRASRDKMLAYIVKQWRKISKQLGVPVPYSSLRQEFQHLKHLKNLFLEEES